MSGRSTTTTAATGRGSAFFRSAPTAGFLKVTLNPDYGKDQDYSCALARGALNISQPARCRICRKLNDGAAHMPNSF
jgi:hypothetical protein